MRARPDPLRSGPQLHAWRTGEWLTVDDLSGPLVVLVHGLAASSASLERLATHIGRTYAVAVFDYVSHEGIDRGADDLSRRLARFAARLQQTGLALIGHSMGGLVVRQFARYAIKDLKNTLRGVATLGTPHRGAAQGEGAASRRRWLAALLDMIEREETADPFARSLACPAAQQLLGTDPQGLIAALEQFDLKDPLRIPMFSFSGGQNYIELFKPGTRWNDMANRMIQANLGLPNDGLVEEMSADITRCGSAAASVAKHCNDYLAWPTTNHTHLTSNQDIGDLLVDWLKGEVFAV